MNKVEKYEEVESQILAVLEDETDRVAQMATVSCLLADAFPDTYFWTGFYIVDAQKENELVVGPYQGTLGCLRIPFGRGVCGTAALERKTQIVEDVHAIENHIACDARTNSEIVVPVYDNAGSLIAVLDIDSEETSSFDAVDQKYLERLVTKIFATD